MKNSSATIDGKKVVSSNILIFHQNQRAEILPFADDNDDFTIVCDFTVDSGVEKPSIKLVASPTANNVTDLMVVANLNGGTLTTSKPIRFASEGAFKYYFTCSINVVGKIDKHTVILQYVVTEAKEG